MLTPRLRGLALTVLSFILAVAVASAATDRMHDFGNRLEGTTSHYNGLNDLSLLAIHRGSIGYTRHSDLHVRFFVPLVGQGESSISVSALELQDVADHYSMRAKPSEKWRPGQWNAFEPWPTKDVIDVLSVAPNNLGVLVSDNLADSPPVYLPATVYSELPGTVGAVYTFFFFTGRDLQSLSVSISNGAGDPVDLGLRMLKCNAKVNRNCKLYAGGTTQQYDIDMSSLSPGAYHVTFSGTVPRSRDLPTMDVIVYHHA